MEEDWLGLDEAPDEAPDEVWDEEGEVRDPPSSDDFGVASEVRDEVRIRPSHLPGVVAGERARMVVARRVASLESRTLAAQG